MAHRTQDVLRLIAGTLTVDEVATRHSVTAAQVERWRDDYLWAVDQLASQRAPRRRFTVLAVVASAALAGVLGFSSDAWAQSCGATLPYGLTAFCPNSPAVATQVNNNFGRVVQLLEQKVGTANTTSVAMTGPVTSSGAVTVNNTVSANTFSTTGTLNFSNSTGAVTWPSGTVGSKLRMASDVHELGVQNQTTYLRSSGGFSFYKGGSFSTSGAGTGGTESFTIDANGTASAAAGLRSRGTTVIRDVTTCCTGSGGCCPGGYAQVGPDLNQNAGGSFCYLCVQRAD